MNHSRLCLFLMLLIIISMQATAQAVSLYRINQTLSDTGSFIIPVFPNDDIYTYAFTPKKTGVYVAGSAYEYNSVPAANVLVYKGELPQLKRVSLQGDEYISNTVAFYAEAGKTYYIEWELYRYWKGVDPNYAWELRFEPNAQGLTPQTAFVLDNVPGMVLPDSKLNDITWYRFSPAETGFYITNIHSEGLKSGNIYNGNTCLLNILIFNNDEFAQKNIVAGLKGGLNESFFAEAGKVYYALLLKERGECEFYWTLKKVELYDCEKEAL